MLISFLFVALSDLLFNIALLIRAIHDISKRRSNRLCIIVSFLSHVAELLSACYTVSFTIQRYTAVRYPLKVAANHHSSPLISLLIIFLCSIIFCLILSSVNPYIDCHEELRLTWFIADALLSFVIPCLLIVLFNILIVKFIRKHSRSQISVQSTLNRKKKSSKKINQDETCLTENNTIFNTCQSVSHFDDNEYVELKNRKDDFDQRFLSSLVRTYHSIDEQSSSIGVLFLSSSLHQNKRISKRYLPIVYQSYLDHHHLNPIGFPRTIF